MEHKAEAKKILAEEILRLRTMHYGQLCGLMSQPETLVREGPSGSRFNLVVEAFWDDREGENLRVMCAIDDGGLSWFAPMASDFIVAPDGSFVGE